MTRQQARVEIGFARLDASVRQAIPSAGDLLVNSHQGCAREHLAE
jgi:hypothetical protein